MTILDRLLPPANTAPTRHLRPDSLKARLASRFNLVIVRQPGLMFRDAVMDADGRIIYESDWIDNALSNDGQASMLNVYFRGSSAPSQYLAILNMASSPPTKTSVMTDLVEIDTPGVNGYSRVNVATGDWAAPSLNSGDMQITAAQKTIGPLTTTSHTVSHVALVTVSTGTSGIITLFVDGTYFAANGTGQVLAAGQSYLVTLSDKQI